MAIDKILGNGDLDKVADSVFSAVNDSVSEIKAMQKRKAAENVQVVIEALKKIESDIKDKYDGVTTVIEKRVASIKDGKDGRNGADGKAGKDGRPGRDGAVGPRGADGLNGRDGKDGENGVSVTDAYIDFDGSLIIRLSSGQTLNVGEVVAPDIAEKIKVITNGGGTSQGVLDTLTSLQSQITALQSLGAVNYRGTWNASTNSPSIVSGTGIKGYYYVVSIAGSTSIDGQTLWGVGDWIIFNGTAWQKVDGGSTGDFTTLTVTGNVGIGTSAPSFPLDVQSTGVGSTIASRIYRSDGTVALLRIGNSSSGALSNAPAFGSDTTSAVFYTTNAERLRIDNAGNVGIGTSSPANKLNLSDANEGTHDLAFNRNTTYGASTGLGGISWYNQVGDTRLTRIDSQTDGAATNARIIFSTASSGTLAERMRLDNAGNVGIGTSAPGSKLDVKGTLRLSGATSGYVGLAPAAAAGSTTYTLPAADGTAGQVLSTNGAATLSWTTASGSGITSGTAVTTTSGTSADFTGIPAGTKRITVMLKGVSTNGTSNFLVQIGDSGGVETSGYTSAVVAIGTTPALASQTIGFILTQAVVAASAYNGHVVITNITGSDWVSSHTFGAGTPQVGTGIKTLSDTLTQVRVTTVNGTDTFDAGTINILYE